MITDRAANTLKQAKDLTLASKSVRFKDQIGGRDTNDFFSFRLGGRSSVNFSLNSGASSKANLQLLNGSGQQLQVGKLQGKALSAINTSLDAGTYYVRVSASAKAKSTQYALGASASLAKPMTSLDNVVLGVNKAIAYPQDNALNKSAASDDGSIIDIMIAYTSDARASEGGTTAINKTIQAAVDEVNQGYANSGIIQRLRLVHTTEVNYAESGNSNTDLTRLQSKSDGYMDDIHTLRDQYGADIVSLFVKKSNTGGNSYTMSQVVPEFESYAFNVVQIDNVKTRFSLGHEVGHNLGAAHDSAHVDSDSAFDYSHGYIAASGVGDVMSYAKDRRNVYSSPNVKINGEVIGTDEADVVRTFNEVRFTAANWRKSVVA